MLNLLMSVGAHWSALSDEISWELLLQIIGALSVAVVATRLFVFAVKLAWTPSGVNWKRLAGKAEGKKKTANWAAISGASDGIGREFALQLARRGFNIFLIGRNKEKLATVQKELESLTAKTEVFVLDYAAPEASAFAQLQKRAEQLPITVLVNNAGVSHEMPTCFAEESRDMLDQIIRVNCTSTVQVTRSILPAMIKNRAGGLVLNMGSVSAELKTPMLQTYAGSKAFLRVWSEALATEVAEHRIHVELLNTHFVTTNMSKIRRSSWTCPTPKTYVQTVLARCGNGHFSTLHPGHALVFSAISLLPAWLIRHMSLKQMKTTRKIALAKAAKLAKAK